VRARQRHRPVLAGISIGRADVKSQATLGMAVYRNGMAGFVITVQHAMLGGVMIQPGYEVDGIDDGIPSQTPGFGDPIATYLDEDSSIQLYKLNPGVESKPGCIIDYGMIDDYVRGEEYEFLSKNTPVVMYGRTSGRVEGVIAETPFISGPLKIKPRANYSEPLTNPGDSGSPWILEEPGQPVKLVALHNHRYGSSYGIPVHPAFHTLSLSLKET